MASASVMPSRGEAAAQTQWLKEATLNIKRNAYGLRKAMDDDNVKDALRYSAAMLAELRTSTLGPQRYYEMYMQVSDQLHFLQQFFAEEHHKGRSYAELYELVQHAANLVPRLYLLCTVGACYIKSLQVPAKLILQDMAEMCRGVQHPTRGLFLRAYLVQACRSLLPATGSPYESPEGGNINDAVEFLLLNFTEMNRLWVRLQHQGGVADQERREIDRRELADLVGKNLTYISQLEGLSFELYRDSVLPRVLEQIVSCRDDMAQQYLMQALILAFPDDFHLGTLGPLLDALPALQPGVKVASVLSSLLDRLAQYAAGSPEAVPALTTADTFGTLATVALSITERRADMPVADIAGMHGALLAFAGNVYPDRLDTVDRVLGTCHDALAPRAPIPAGKAERELVALLSAPLEKHDVVAVLGLKHYPALLGLLRPQQQRAVALNVVRALQHRNLTVASAEHAELVLSTIAPLIRDVEGIALEASDVEDDSVLIASLVSRIQSEDLDEQLSITQVLLAQFVRASPVRQRVLLPPVAFAAMAAFRKVLDAHAGGSLQGTRSLEDWAKLVHRTATAVAEVPDANVALQIFLMAASLSSRESSLNFITYDLFEQGFLLYEEAIPDSKREVQALASITSTLHACRLSDEDMRAALVHKASGYCGKLLRRADQCAAVLNVSQLYWQPLDEAEEGVEELPPEEGEEGAEGAAPARPAPVRDAAAVLSSLKRALRIAHALQQQILQTGRGEPEGPGLLFLQILNRYLFFFERGVSSIELGAVQNMLDLVTSELSSPACRDKAELQAFYANTLDHIRSVQARDGAGSGLYANLRLP